jgi:hypothetical protein
VLKHAYQLGVREALEEFAVKTAIHPAWMLAGAGAASGAALGLAGRPSADPANRAFDLHNTMRGGVQGLGAGVGAGLGHLSSLGGKGKVLRPLIGAALGLGTARGYLDRDQYSGALSSSTGLRF